MIRPNMRIRVVPGTEDPADDVSELATHFWVRGFAWGLAVGVLVSYFCWWGQP
jgi:hypothetical protein